MSVDVSRARLVRARGATERVVAKGNERTPRPSRLDGIDDDDEDWFSRETRTGATGKPAVRARGRRDPDSAYGNGRRERRDDDDAEGTPSKRERGARSLRTTATTVDAESAMKVMDDAIDAVIVGSIGATSAAVRALSRGASYYLGDAFDSAGRAKKEDDGDGDSWLKTPRGREGVVTPRAMRFESTPASAATTTTVSDAREIETLRRRLAEADAEIRRRDGVVDDLKRQNLAIQRRQAARERKSRGDDDETRALVEQLRAQVESLMREKATLTRENARLARENGDLHAFARGAASDTEEYDEASDDASSSEIGKLNPEEMMKLEREIAEMEASLENTTLEYAATNSSMDRSDDAHCE